jgi:hypothetical protein
MNDLDKALGWLLERDYFAKDDDGWCAPVKPPSEEDLAQYVSCVAELGRQAVTTRALEVPAAWVRIDGKTLVMQFKSSSRM